MEKKEPISADMVREFVTQAHQSIKGVQELLEKEPTLINAVWDWGGGDWETALGAAAHMGRRDIAHYLLENGARMDIFAAAMLGHLEVVQAILKADPGASNHPGPHGIPLLLHAQVGGKDAAVVVEWLQANISSEAIAQQ